MDKLFEMLAAKRRRLQLPHGAATADPVPPPPTAGLATFLLRDVGDNLNDAPSRRAAIGAYVESLTELLGGAPSSVKRGKREMPVVVSAEQRRHLLKCRRAGAVAA